MIGRGVSTALRKRDEIACLEMSLLLSKKRASR